MGLVQIFRASQCPPLVARTLLVDVLADFRETGYLYLLHLARCRDDAWANGTEEQVEALDAKIREHLMRAQIPQRWQLDRLFSIDAYKQYGDGLLACWAFMLIQICTLEQYWEDIVLGYRPTSPNFLQGFHAEEDVYSTDWLDDFRPGWAAKLQAVVAVQDGIYLPLTIGNDDGPDDAGYVH